MGSVSTERRAHHAPHVTNPHGPTNILSSLPSVTRFRDQELDFEVQLWFSYGAMYIKGTPDRGLAKIEGPSDFETRVREYYRPEMKAMGYERHPDLILFATGIWDVSSLWYDNYHASFTNRTLKNEMPFSWQELVFQRKRLLEMKR